MKKKICSILPVIYLYMFTFFRVPIVFGLYSADLNKIILGISAVILLIMSMFFSKCFINRRFLVGLLLIFSVSILLMLDLLFRINTVTMSIAYDFIIYGIIPIILFSQVEDYNIFLKTYVVLGVITFIIYFMDPLNGYLISFEYMIFGFQVMLPAFFSAYAGYVVFRKRVLGLISVIAIIEIMVWGNRMALICAIFYICVIEVFYRKKSLRKMINILVVSIILIIIILNIDRFLMQINNILLSYNINSYSIRSLIDYFNGNSSYLSYGRNVMWDYAIELIKNKPIIGYGTGYFQNIYGVYVHNFVLDVIVSYGIVIFIISFLIIINSLKTMIKSKGDVKFVGIILFCTSFPKLMTSIYFFKEPAFWLFIAYGLFLKVPRKNENKE